MITKVDIIELLELLNYSKKGGIYYKQFNDISIKVDISNETIIYPTDVLKGDGTTSNFQNNENFVVFECVNRLLSKGYKAKNIELEHRWKVGTGASGGKTDILVKDNENNAFLIIECKTHGKEYEKAWANTRNNGGQLFTYAHQDRHTQYLCLYASNIEDGKLSYSNNWISLKDNDEYLKTLKPSQILRFNDATGYEELYKVWKNVYHLHSETTGIFEDNIPPYEINKPYTVDDLKSINFEDYKKKYHEFETILRKHNVSSHENAFDKLVNVFLAKIVDEIQHGDMLQFYWGSTAYDDYYQLQDRLQKLYRDGMQKFLNEEVTYIDNNDLNNAFKFFKNDPDATRNTVMDYFRQLKFFTNNDFAFIDVHNEKLFEQNSKILLEIVKMFQDIKLKTDDQNQFLGDLFEDFLDDGIKQSEGQFFTPLPITRFIISSLPLEKIILNLDEPPRVIDYACGAGHFLNEYARQIRQYLDEEQLSKYYSNIYGIEKEYRLSKVSKVSAFMYGQNEINILYGDALVNNEYIKYDSYDILIANPPFSVEGFLETLNAEERENYELISSIDKNKFSSNSSIETFFVERTKQLLKEGGVAGIILYYSVLTRNSGLDIKTREMIISNFDIISIVELPPGTFRATNVETVILFLRKKKNNPSLLEHFKNRINDWFDCNFDKDQIFEDKELFLDYLNKQNIEYDDYIDFLNGNINDSLKENDVFRQYIINNFDEKLIRDLEKDKLLYFLLLKNQNNDIVIVNAPPKRKTGQIKKYLGYKWSEKKVNKGINYIDTDNNDNLSKDQAIMSIKTNLFNPVDLNDENKINTIIRYNFEDKENIENENVNFIDATDLISFDRHDFDKTFNLSIKKTKELKSKHQLKFISEILINTNNIENISNIVPKEEYRSEGKIPIISQNKDLFIEGYTNDYEPITEFPLIVFGDHNCHFKYIDFEFVRGADNTQIILTNENEVRLKYFYYTSFILDIGNLDKYARHFTYLKRTKIPIPPISIQDKVINQCEEVDEEYEQTRMSIDEYINNLKQIFIEEEIIYE